MTATGTGVAGAGLAWPTMSARPVRTRQRLTVPRSTSKRILVTRRSGIVRRRTRRTGRFDYRVTLPEQVEADQIEASLADGVLAVRVPKSERAQHTKIEIKGS